MQPNMEKFHLEQAEIEAILDKCKEGVLCTIGTDGYPYGTPVNYVRDGDRILFHGRKMGEKVDNLSVDAASKQAIEAVRMLCADVKIPPLCETKFRMEDIDTLAKNALLDTAAQTNIVRATLDDVKTIIAKTYYEGVVMKKVNANG